MALAAIACVLLSHMRVCTASKSSETERLDKALQEAQTEEVAWKYVPLSGPAIDPEFSPNVSSQIGKTIVLNCRIKYGGGKTLSWMRTRDLHLLTVGRFTYTSDDRFRAVHQSGSADWMLKIHYVQKRDHGGYECQVSTTPPLSHTVWLQVVEPETRILGDSDIHIHAGSNINLTCVVRHSPKAPAYMLWYHGKELLSYDSPRGGITVVTESSTSTTSRLLIQRASPSDAGRYTCRPANADPHFVTVHVVPNEQPAAIQHKNGTTASSSDRPRTRLLFLPLLLLLVDWMMLPLHVSSCYGLMLRKRMTEKTNQQPLLAEYSLPQTAVCSENSSPSKKCIYPELEYLPIINVQDEEVCFRHDASLHQKCIPIEVSVENFPKEYIPNKFPRRGPLKRIYRSKVKNFTRRMLTRAVQANNSGSKEKFNTSLANLWKTRFVCQTQRGIANGVLHHFFSGLRDLDDTERNVQNSEMLKLSE